MQFYKGQPKAQKSGRQLGSPNKATADVRAAIARLLEETAPEFKGWLQQVADGIPKQVRLVTHEDGSQTTHVDWLRPPDPHKALDLITNLAEYHIPKLSRVELKNPDGQTLNVSITRFTEQPAPTAQSLGATLPPAAPVATP